MCRVQDGEKQLLKFFPLSNFVISTLFQCSHLWSFWWPFSVVAGRLEQCSELEVKYGGDPGFDPHNQKFWSLSQFPHLLLMY